ncbi:MAG: RNA methyltransferase [Bacteroidales bacterium]|jgi:TrmH family RNA methyltransferase
MLTQNEIKHIKSLQQKKFRREFNQFVAEGPKLVEELIDSKFSFAGVYAKKEWFNNNAESLLKKEIPFTEISSKEMERISGLVTPNNVLAVLKMPEENIPQNIFGKELILVLDDIKDPGNLGTIIRTADWFGISNIICSEESVDIYNPKVIQATMGSVARVNVYYTDLVALFKEIKGKASIYGTFMDGDNIKNIKPEPAAIIVIGNEAKGVSAELIPFIQKRIFIPSHRMQQENNPESLNASIAAAVVCYEFRRN